MLKRAIRFFESTHERACRDLNLDKAEILVALRCLHDEIASSQPAPIDDDQANPTSTTR